MTDEVSCRHLTRRQVLQRSVAAGAVAVAGLGYIASPDASWALETRVLTGHQMATLLQMARDIYPHDRIADKYYAIAIAGYDRREDQTMVSEGVGRLDALARAAGAASYLLTKWEDNRVALLRQIEDGEFFETVRAGLVTGLYNQKAVWPIFGYEGESFSGGGYINRGFDDIEWL